MNAVPLIVSFIGGYPCVKEVEEKKMHPIMMTKERSLFKSIGLLGCRNQVVREV